MNNQRVVLIIGALALLMVILGTMAGVGVGVLKGTMALIGKGAGIIVATLLVLFALKNIQKKGRP